METRPFVIHSKDYNDYLDLTSEYLQTKQRLMALVDKDRPLQNKLERHFALTKDNTLIPQIEAIISARETAVSACRDDLNKIIKTMTDCNYQKRWLGTPLKKALYAKDLE